MAFLTVGHSTRSMEDFITLLRNAAAGHLIDVRRYSVSRRYPHFNSDRLAASLLQASIRYTHMEKLGGRRKARADGRPSHNTLWREEGFRNYADYAETPEFHAALNELRSIERTTYPVIMCAEAVWWKCHRRIITDYLLAAGSEVNHILDNKIEAARLTDGAIVRTDGTIIYSDTPLLVG